MVHCHTQTSLRTGRAGFAPLLAAALLVLLLAGMQQTGAFPSWRLEVGSDRFKTCSHVQLVALSLHTLARPCALNDL